MLTAPAGTALRCVLYTRIYFFKDVEKCLKWQPNSRQKAAKHTNTHALVRSAHTCWHKEKQRHVHRQAQRERERHHRLQRQEVGAFFGWFSPHLTSDKPRFIQRANCLPVCLHTTHTQTSRWTAYCCHFLLQPRLQFPGQMPSKTTSGCSKRLNAALSRSHRPDPK